MADKVIMTVKPRIEGLDEYMAKAEKLSALLSEAIRLHSEMEGAVFEVSYDVESPTLNS